MRYFYSEIAKIAQLWELRPQAPLPPDQAGGFIHSIQRLMASSPDP